MVVESRSPAMWVALAKEGNALGRGDRDTPPLWGGGGVVGGWLVDSQSWKKGIWAGNAEVGSFLIDEWEMQTMFVE